LVVPGPENVLRLAAVERAGVALDGGPVDLRGGDAIQVGGGGGDLGGRERCVPGAACLTK
jgi:hypothetical protein